MVLLPLFPFFEGDLETLAVTIFLFEDFTVTFKSPFFTDLVAVTLAVTFFVLPAVIVTLEDTDKLLTTFLAAASDVVDGATEITETTITKDNTKAKARLNFFETLSILSLSSLFCIR
jgi:hypothetical protein